MKEKINIAEILKDKPEGMKLWTDMFGSVTLYCVTDACDAFQVKHHHNKEPWFDENGKMCKEGVCASTLANQCVTGLSLPGKKAMC